MGVSVSAIKSAWGFQNSYARLPERFFARLSAVAGGTPKLIEVNTALTEELGLSPDLLRSPEGVAVLAGRKVAEGSEPLALAYAGHQFGYFVPQLGDGRANLLGEVIARDGARYDIQLKGSGRTPFSRGGDGRAALGPVLREYVVSEAMAALGVPTTRALAAVTTGEEVARETMLPGAVLTRVASSHLRVGTFQYFAVRNDVEGLRTLANYAIERHYASALQTSTPYLALLEGVIERQAHLVAQWMLLGFIHGVMNTDNTSISGETIDYGPCAFLEPYDPEKVFSSIDRQGRYAYGNQPQAMHWNLVRLAESLLPLLHEEAGSPEAGLAAAKRALERFLPSFEAAHRAGLRRKLGLASEREGDDQLGADLLALMASAEADFTLTFRRLSNAARSSDDDAGLRELLAGAEFSAWLVRWRERLGEEGRGLEGVSAEMRAVNPAFIPRNHRVQAMIDAAVDRGDYAPFQELLRVVTHPFEDQPEKSEYSMPATARECVQQTFCGT